MELFKDFLRIVGLGLFAYAVYSNSVASAIAGGGLYMGGFGDDSALARLFQRPKKSPPELKIIRLQDHG